MFMYISNKQLKSKFKKFICTIFNWLPRNKSNRRRHDFYGEYSKTCLKLLKKMQINGRFTRFMDRKTILKMSILFPITNKFNIAVIKIPTVF